MHGDPVARRRYDQSLRDPQPSAARIGGSRPNVGRRPDDDLYPTPTPAPYVTDNVAVAFQLDGPDPVQIGNAWSFTISLLDPSGVTPKLFRDSNAPQGFATSVLGYSSKRYPQLVFSSVTGANEVVQADTTLLGADLQFGVVSYK